MPPALPLASSDACTEDAGLVTCLVGDLDVATTIEREILATAAAAGTWSTTATIVSSTTDHEPANDTAESETTLVAAEDFIFADGFESGDSSAWSASILPTRSSEGLLGRSGRLTVRQEGLTDR